MSRNMEKSVKVSEEICKKNSCHREIESLLGRLHLQDKFEQNFSPADFLQICPPVKQHHVTSEKELAQMFLHRLMMLDYRARYIPVSPHGPERTNPKPVPMSDINSKDDSDWDIFLNASVNTDQTEQTHVHPMDVQMAVFRCSDSFLKQMMITKLSQCQYALPLLVPDPVTKEIECPLWTFRQITKTWKVTQIKDDSNIVTMKSVPVCKAETPLVSFFRLGSLSVSKSQLINTLINDRHSTFFHRNCPGSTKSRYLMDGVAEIAWYCPAGKPNDAFNDCIAFCNLRGDALLSETQRDILIEKSSINIFLVASLQKREESRSLISALLKSHKTLICLCVDDSCDAVKTKRGKYKMGLKDRSQSDVSEELKQIIREVLSSVDGSSLKPSFQLETMAELSGIRVDESDPACQKGKSAAMKIMDLVTKDYMDVSKIKDKFLPCQGRLQQELMKLFTDSLSSLPTTEKEYFLKWIQILRDTLSTDYVSLILQSYDKTQSEVLALKNKCDKSDLLLRKQTELEEISKKLQSATFGLEHIFREMGQIYEAHRATEGESRHTDWSKYPELAAQLMISGHPVELMDGDAGHIPLTWISSLLEEVIKKLGDQRVFVLSVLGIQSSGKSTMLNTMFGLQFAVSAGRCTKGAFMQMLKVSEEMMKDFKFDYVLVVDTEGLSALELEGNATRHHDNELATFVVGLGNLTLINIFGEDPSEMQDILQIVVQAFMRMKKVKLSPSCVFVHQNVTDVAAAEKNMDGKRRLQEKLDQMAKLAAKEEVYNAECFSDIIEFDVQKDVKYCAQLWEGSPPMAPPNPGYSESIQELKSTIFSKASKSSGITLSQFKIKIQDLWNALLNETFVFSFKNTLEIVVYTKPEAQNRNQLHQTIENGNLDKVENDPVNKCMNQAEENTCSTINNKSVKVSEEICKKNSCHREIESLLGRLHLQDKFEQNLVPADFLQICPPVKQHHVTSEKDLAHTFLHRLMMLDYRARYILVRPDGSEGTHPKPIRVIDITENEFNDLDALLSTSAERHKKGQTHVHPMDVQMAVFHCSDSFLKQMMITKLSQCQYALPLLVPDPVTKEIKCPLWTFRQITKTWKVTQIKDDSNIVTMKSVPVCKAETPLVSFFRLGSLSVSKSQLMNTLINDRHSTFFHRNCTGSTKSRYLMDGVAEIAWYCPAGKPNDAFNDCIAFCNLHGDALLSETQRDTLIEKSSINIVLVASLQKHEESRSLISDLLKSHAPLICLCVDDSCDAVKTKRGKYKMGLKDRSQSDVSEELKQIIREVLSSVDGSSLKPSFQLETMAELSGIRVDESDPACQKGKSAAMKIMDLVTKDYMDVSKIKDKFLPCQGRLQQELMKLFTDSLSSLPTTEKEYFLKWIQILRDTLSTDYVSLILQSYDKTRSEVLALKNKCDKSDLLLRKQTDLEEISKKLQSATFGLEHIFREMGQIYEAHRATLGESRHTDWSKYPELAAQLMISGHPVELMDGDAGHIPLTWISSLLEEVIKKLGDQRVFVLSVLGIQSSGKSTMLNTMFGLQFAVSAGRCTKGAFMQMLKVSEEMKKDFKFDYVLVVDTEGLSALELEGNSTRHHDNELATFVVGLGNLTLINIFGEDPSEMQDILQIVVQAFMRMKKVKLSPSCVFVHQNVTDVAAAEKNMDGKRCLQEKLDQMAKLAAKEEVYNAECFSDIIEFDVQKDVKYCAQLWEGSPPMAPPNPGYSESIQELKSTIFSKASKSSGITLSEFKTKIQDLWNALLNENFFSFKNT